jgi:hypothetical protein
MTLNEFIEKYDFPGAVVLLEGKREVKEQDKEKLTALGRLLAASTTNMIFRSGNAEGADYFFSQGVADASRLEVITPYTGHRSKANKAAVTIPLDEINLTNEPEIAVLSKSNRKTERLINDFIEGTRNRYTIKAAYIIRDTVKVTGASGVNPASFAVFYDDLENPETGGTGHTMNICRIKNIGLADQRIWSSWLQD